MYSMLIPPHFTYSSTVWHYGNDTQTNKLQDLQKRATQVITGLGYETRSADIFKRLGWEPISNLLRKHEELMIFKSLKRVTPILI